MVIEHHSKVTIKDHSLRCERIHGDMAAPSNAGLTEDMMHGMVI
jgi:hypothetical protein